MPRDIDPETMPVDDLPGVWSPVQWELNEDERIYELQMQANASLLWTVDIPEAVLRLLFGETDIERAFAPPKGYDPERQGNWDSDLVTFNFKREFKLLKVDREPGYLYVEYNISGLGDYAVEITPREAHIFQL